MNWMCTGCGIRYAEYVNGCPQCSREGRLFPLTEIRLISSAIRWRHVHACEWVECGVSKKHGKQRWQLRLKNDPSGNFGSCALGERGNWVACCYVLGHHMEMVSSLSSAMDAVENHILRGQSVPYKDTNPDVVTAGFGTGVFV